MTFRELLTSASRRLQDASTPYLDALVLLSHASGMKKERLLADLPLQADEITAVLFEGFIQRRLAGEPVSYIRNRKEFWGLDFYVDSRVLVPRPDTEVLVEEALRLIAGNPSIRRIHDSCTGSGCIAVALKSEYPDLDISISDISADALEVADFNARSLTGKALPSSLSNLLSSVQGSFDLITCNPPYVEHDYVEHLKENNWPEPALALDGGESGFDLIPRLIEEALDSLNENGYLIIEASPVLVPLVAETMGEYNYTDIVQVTDLAGKARIARGRKGPCRQE
ncbi:protein-(glutamine-N5) methyltransferase, release factor-specific [Marispirochaeta aestuarii]|uniref:peptide chain release factor N(5)-glutamine methyltransferase n=1 Tax=Marispirochaeta aestuarii TaxID=1963862 RepID=A0A1Y1S2T4_9SPIO|nr:peptide chain release factor N(5)-glutamine methyltransferase [Marispirochaeta aestuarii]ORC38288.1 protein-(glutamine-N5) methyltransferase, release factor-specific [Marispirochaeta aestuarii]